MFGAGQIFMRLGGDKQDGDRRGHEGQAVEKDGTLFHDLTPSPSPAAGDVGSAPPPWESRTALLIESGSGSVRSKIESSGRITEEAEVIDRRKLAEEDDLDAEMPAGEGDRPERIDRFEMRGFGQGLRRNDGELERQPVVGRRVLAREHQDRADEDQGPEKRLNAGR